MPPEFTTRLISSSTNCHVLTWGEAMSSPLKRARRLAGVMLLCKTD